jgi:large subunit ribosomal protein L4
MAFPPNNRNFDVKVNRKARKAALRSALSAHAHGGTLGLLDPAAFDAPSTRAALELLGGWGKELPLLVVVQPEEEAVIKSFRNLQRVMVTVPAELEVTDVVRVRSLLISESALELVQGRAQ